MKRSASANQIYRQRQRLFWAGLLMLLAPAVFAGPVRVATWNLLPKEAALADANAQKAPGNLVLEAVAALKDLNPDIILLQQAPDLASCEELAKALDSASYRVAVCSAFRDPLTGELARQQVAIIVRGKPDNASSEAWAPGGYAYATLRIENRLMAFFSVQMSDGAPPDDRSRETAAQQAARETAARQLVAKIEALREPGSNAVEGVVVGGDFNTSADNPKTAQEMTLARFERAGLASVFGALPAEKRVTLPGNGKRSDATADYIFARDSGKVSSVQVLPVAMSEHRLVSCELDWTPVVAATQPTPAQPAITPTAVSTNAIATAAPPTNGTPSLAMFWHSFVAQAGVQNMWWFGGLLCGGIILLGGGAWMVARGRVASNAATTSGTMTLATTPHGTAVRMESAPEQLRAGLGQWMRERLTGRLVSDRARLMEVQEAAAVKIQSVDDRLTKVEAQIQHRNREYERRIEALERELLTAKEENRELIRAKIAQVRAEMERERARLMKEAHEHPVA